MGSSTSYVCGKQKKVKEPKVRLPTMPTALSEQATLSMSARNTYSINLSYADYVKERKESIYEFYDFEKVPIGKGKSC